MTKKKKDWIFAIAFVVTAALLIQLASLILRPPQTQFGSTWREFLCEPRDSIDIIFLGSSYAYCDWNPGVVYGKSGLTGYVLAGSTQTPNLTCRYLSQALKTQSPQAVVMEGSSFLFGKMKPNYTQINIVYMPQGIDRLRAVLNDAPSELRTGLLFDLYFYHDRWKTLTLEDVKDRLTPPTADVYKGYTFLTEIYDASELGGPTRREPNGDAEIYNGYLDAFREMSRLCAEKGVDIIITINPTYYQCAPEVYESLRRDLLEIDPTVRFVCLADSLDEMGIDLSRDLYDSKHLNFFGSYKYSEWTADYLLDCGYTPRSQSTENKAAWDETAQYWQDKLAQLGGT